jgi:hypothetical protein
VTELRKSIKGNLDFEKEINRNKKPIEGRARGLYLQTMKMSDSELWLVIAQKQMEVDAIMEKVSRELNLSFVS